MRITVFGATGGVGSQVVQQALDAGHEVTAVVRDPGRVTARHAALQVVTADVTDPSTLEPALEGRDAAVSGLGPRGRADAGIATRATTAILRALDQTGVRRITVVSAAPVGPPAPADGVITRRLMYPLLTVAFRPVYEDLAGMEAALQGSATEWTSVRPPRLTNGPLTGRYRTAVGANVSRARTISRADVAHAMLASLTDPAMIKQIVGVTS